jgi:hypothetical protein
VAGGTFTPRPGTAQHAFVAVEKNGVWGKAFELSPKASFERYGAWVSSVSCASAGNCAAGGTYQDPGFGYHAFVVAEKNGVWRAAVRVPGTIGGNSDGDNPFRAYAEVTSVSCGTAGHCGVGGFTNNNRHNETFFETEKKNGAWGTAVRVPGTAALDLGGGAYVTSVSCTRTNACVTAGFYDDASFDNQAFVTKP